MKKELKDWIVPWLYTAREYNVGILDKAWANPDHARLMLNENPIQPSEKVVEAVAQAIRNGNRYPDSFLRLRTKIGKMYDLGPDNVALCNGSSETIDAMMRVFLQPGDEITKISGDRVSSLKDFYRLLEAKKAESRKGDVLFTIKREGSELIIGLMS